MALQTVEQLREENRVLKSELERLEELLAASRAERDQIGVRYNAVSERLEALLKKERGDVTLDDAGRQNLVQQNIELRRKLEEEHSNYKRKLQFYQDGQTRQAQLVQKLQAKVLQYKNRCAEYEEQLRQLQTDSDHARKTTIKLSTTQESYETEAEKAQKNQRLGLDQLDSDRLDLDAAVIQLEGEQNRVEHLTHVNELLREQLDKTIAANQSATADLHKWIHIGEEMEAKEEEWKKEEQAFNDYYAHMHSHLIELWQTICAFRREFDEMKLASEHELAHLSSEFSNDTQNIVLQLRNHRELNKTAMAKEQFERSTLEHRLADKVREFTDLQAKYDAQAKEFSTRNNELSIQNERLRLQMQTAEKEQHKRRASENDEASDHQLRSKIDRLTERNSAFESLRHLARELLDKCDNVDSTMKLKVDLDHSKYLSEQQLELSSVIRTRSISHSPLRSRTRSPSANSDETVSLVRRALQRSRQQIIELSSRLISLLTEKQSIQNQLDDFISERQRMEALNKNLQDERDKLTGMNQDSLRQVEHVKSLLEATSAEKEKLDQNGQRLLEKKNRLTVEIHQLKSANDDLQKQWDDLKMDKGDLNKDLERQVKEVERCRRLLEQSEEKVSQLKEELVVMKETLNATQFRKEMAEREKEEADGALSREGLRRAELEAELSRAKAEEANLKDSLSRSQALNGTVTNEKMELSHSLTILQSENKTLMNKISGLEKDLLSLRSELVTVEREKTEVENQKSALAHSLKLGEKAQRDLEEERHKINLERNELHERLNESNHQKNLLIEEIQDAQNEIKRLFSGNSQAIAEKEQLARHQAELTVKNSSLEKVIQQQNEALAGMNLEKNSLEAEFYKLQQLNTHTEKERQMLQMENQELLSKREQLQAALSQSQREMEANCDRLTKLEAERNSLKHQSLLKDQEHEERMKQERIRNEDNLKQHVRDSEQRLAELRSELNSLKQQFGFEREEMISHHEQEIKELNSEIENIQQVYDEEMAAIKQERQQAIANSERENARLHESLFSVQKELRDSIASHENQKKDWMRQQEQLQGSVTNFQAEIKKLRTQLDDSEKRYESEMTEMKKMNAAYKDLQSDKDSALSELAELRLQLKGAEESRDSLKHDLIELSHRLKEVDEAKNLAQGEVANLKQALKQEAFEKDAAQKDLQNLIKKTEGEKLEQIRTLQDLKQRNSALEEQKLGIERETEELRARLREAEKTELELRRTQQELSRLMQQIENERSRMSQESVDLQGQIFRSQQKEEELKNENSGLKQKVIDIKGRLEGITKEMNILKRKKTALEEDIHLREKDFKGALEESQLKEKSATEHGKHLEKILDSANLNIASLRLRLSEADGKIKGLEEQLTQIENGKVQAEDKLGSIVSCLQRTIGLSKFGIPGSRSTIRRRSRSPGPQPVGSIAKFVYSRQRSLSQTRSRRSESPSILAASDINPEMIRVALQDLLQRITQLEHEKIESVSTLRTLRNKLQEVDLGHQQSSQKVQQLQRALSEAEESKREFESQVSAAQRLKFSHEETLRQHDNKRRQLTEEISKLQRNLATAEEEKQQLQGLREKLKSVEAKAESEKRALRRDLEEVESRLAKEEVEFEALERENQQLKNFVNEKEADNKSLVRDLEKHGHLIQDLEEKLRGLEDMNRNLNQVVDRTQAELEFKKNELQSGNALMQERSAAMTSLQERLMQLQHTLEGSEQDRKTLQDRLENNRHGLNEAKNQNHVLHEKIQDLEHRVSTNERQRAELESQNKQSALVVKKKEELEQELLEKIQKLQAEKVHLQECLSILQRNQANTEMEKLMAEKSNGILEKDKASLVKALEKNRELERLGKLKQCEDCLNFDRRLRHLDEDNAELQRQLQTLQAQLDQADLEHEQKLADLTIRQRNEQDFEINQIRLEAQKNLGDHERATHHRISSLENQILMLRRELELEIRKREQYISHGLTVDGEAKDFSSGVKLKQPSSDLNPLLLENDSKTLDDQKNHRLRGTLAQSAARKANPAKFDFSSQNRVTRSNSVNRLPLPVLLRHK